MEQELCMTRLDWVEESNQSVWNVSIKFDTRKEQQKLSVLEGKQCQYDCKTVPRENHVNRENNSLEFKI